MTAITTSRPTSQALTPSGESLGRRWLKTVLATALAGISAGKHYRTAALHDETVRKNWQYYIIDGFILSPNVELQSICTFDESFVYSDHNPVELTVYLKP